MHGIAVYRDGAWVERGEVTLAQAAEMLNLSSMRSYERFARVLYLPSNTVRVRHGSSNDGILKIHI